MSWSISFKGTKTDALTYVARNFDGAASNYDRHDSQIRDEYRDVLAAKESALTMIASVNEAPDAGGGEHAITKPGVSVSCYGSRSTGYGGNAHVSVDRVQLDS